MMRILIESSSAYATPISTGIQRVVRSTIREIDRLENDDEIVCLPVVFRGGRFYDANDAWRRKILQQSMSNRCHSWRMMERNPDKPKSLVHSAFSRLRKVASSRTARRWFTNSHWRVTGKRISFRPGDVLLLMDETWNLPLWPAVKRARKSGCLVGSVVYDMLPMEFPQFFKSEFADAFPDWLTTQNKYSDFYLTISHDVRDRLQDYLSGAAKNFGKPVEAFRLGSDFPPANVDTDLRPELKAIFGAEGVVAPFLSVGTLEPRKNYRYLLDAFDLFWRQFPAARLCLVGRAGWKCSDLIDQIRNHPVWNSSLFWFDDLSDGELDYCYRRSRAVISASIAEGFGLPIVEGLVRGVPVFASDIPVHREAGGPHCEYFDLKAPGNLTSLLLNGERYGWPAKASSCVSDTAVTWSTSCRKLVAKCSLLQAIVFENKAALNRQSAVHTRAA